MLREGNKRAECEGLNVKDPVICCVLTSRNRMTIKDVSTLWLDGIEG